MNIDRIRADTPAVRQINYLHNAGAALMPDPVIHAMKGYIDLEAAIGGYAAADHETVRLEGVYDSVARLLNATPGEIALTENATVAWQMAFYAMRFVAGDRILTSQSEYGANYVAFLQMALRTGVIVEVIPNDESGATDPAALARMIDDRVKLIAITWVPTNGGLVNPAAGIGALAKKAAIPFLLDACQAVGQMPVDVQALGCTMLSGTGRKFLRGPRGTGFLYVRKDVLPDLEPPMIDHYSAPWAARDRYELRPDARRFETWENNYAARMGLGVAVDYALALGLDDIAERCRSLSGQLRDGLRRIGGVTILDLGRDPSAIVSFTIDGVHASDAVAAASAESITIGVSNPSSTRLDAEARSLPPLVRASPHYYNTEHEISQLIALCERLATGRKVGH